jgi:hypothetical protein
VNLVLPIAAHELDYRYAISAVPFACLALGLTFVRKPVASGASGTSGTSAAAVVASGTGASVEVTPGVEADAAD